MITVLFLAANPEGQEPPIRTDREFKEIKDALSRAAGGPRIALHLPELAVRPQDLSRALHEAQPTIVHFAGHGGGDEGIFLEDEQGHTKPVSAEALASVFRRFEYCVKVVVLNACFTKPQSEAIAEHIDYVIGTRGQPEDDTSIAFSRGFYRALAAGRSIEDAFQLGRDEIGIEGIPEEAIPILIPRELKRTERRPNWAYDPYPGLQALDQWQAPIFFGRKLETRELLRFLTKDQGQRFLLVTGPSGSGKSSLVRAGVWAALAAGTVQGLPGSGHWLITDMRPAELGGDPFSALVNSLKRDQRLAMLRPAEEADRLKSEPAAFDDLIARALDGRPSTGEWLLVLDQMEELFTPQCARHRALFLDRLLAASELRRFRVIATVRSDFLDRCVDHPGLLAVQNNGGQYGLRRPGREGMTQMVEGPVEELALANPVTLDPDLVTRMVDDAVNEDGGLALLAFTLKDLYERSKTKGHMDLDAYEDPAFGGLKGVIQRRADRALERAGAGGRDAVPKVFSRLILVPRYGKATRSRESQSWWNGEHDALRLIEEFTQQDTRLLVADSADNPVIEVAHEALLNEWPLLANWIAEKTDALRLQERIEADAAAWAETASDKKDFQLWPHEVLDPALTLLSNAGLLEVLKKNPVVEAFLTPEADRLSAKLKDQSTTHYERANIGDRLATIGDIRVGVDTTDDDLPYIDWIPVPDDEEHREDSNQQRNTARIDIARFPITWKQYRAFLEAPEGYINPEWWDSLYREKTHGRQYRLVDNCPAENVSWFDAFAFCRWLSRHLDAKIRLPWAYEWHLAATGGSDKIDYPWGTEWTTGLANTRESGLGRTTAVGMYPAGKSSIGAFDMAGNVWEWCLDKYSDLAAAKPQNGVIEYSNRRSVVRGGSWSDDQFKASSSYRDYGPVHPRNRLSYIGFRVVRELD